MIEIQEIVSKRSEHIVIVHLLLRSLIEVAMSELCDCVLVVQVSLHHLLLHL